MAFVDPRKLAVTPKPYAGVVPPAAPKPPPIQGPPAPMTYKMWLNSNPGVGPSSAKNALSWWNQYGKAMGVAKPGSQTPAPAPGAASPPATAQPPSAPVGSDPTAAAPPPAPTSALDANALAVSGTPQIDMSGLTSLPMPKTFPTFDINSLYAPAQRSLDQRRAALDAARTKAQADNDAFASYINGLTSQSSAALGGTMAQLGQQANDARSQSLGSINDIVQQALQSAGPGAQNADLMRLSGGAAQQASDSALQTGQAAQNALPNEIAQADLQRQGVDQGNIDKASDRLMQLNAGTQANAALADIGKDQYGLDTSKAQAGVQNVMSIRDYMTNIAAQRQAAAIAQGNLGVKSQANFAHVLAANSQALGRMTVAQINKFVDAQIAKGNIDQKDRADAIKLAIGRGNNRATVLSAVTRANASGAPKPGTIAAKGSNALAKYNSNQDTLQGSYDSLNTQAKGQRAQNGAAAMAAAYPQMGWKTAGPILVAAYPDRMKDPAYVARVQALFTGTQ